ncbi:hypothetical protein ACNOYE_00055 [Nannocystaceae bacterium ST9]
MRPSIAALALALATFACAGSDEPPDELSGAVIDELATDQGSASGSAWSGIYAAEFSKTSCDCPTLDIDGMPLDVCSLVVQNQAEIELTQADGFLVVEIGSTMAMLTGAIEADDGFVVAGHQNLSTVVGVIELLGRIDGSLEMVDGVAWMSGDLGQRVIGEFAGTEVDCRWIGEVSASRGP